MNDWSIKSIQDLVLEKKEWDKKNLYATDSSKCPAGIYHQLIGAKSTTPDDPQGLRRMEVGSMVELNQVKKLRSLGLLIEAQRRIVDEEFNVSGRHDGIVISPTSCTEEAKKLIERKKIIYSDLEEKDKVLFDQLDSYRQGNINQEEFLRIQAHINKDKQDLYDEDHEINKELLKPNPENSLILMEIKSIKEAGFKWRLSDGKPMDDHRNQIMFYLWKLRLIYPWILGRVVYVDTTYQDILEFNVDFDESVIDNLKKFWAYINECVKTKTPPVAAPDIIQDQKSGLWKLNWQADWCRYHEHCTGDPLWKSKAIQKIVELNANIPRRGRTYTRRSQ